MAGAPHKQGLIYYSFDVNTFTDNRKIQEFIDVHKAEGFLFLKQMECAILSKSNYLVWDRFERVTFRKQHEYKDAQIEHYLNALFDFGFLNRRLFDTYNVLTSEELQGKYMLSVKGRSKVIYIQEYTLIRFEDYRFFDQVIHIMNINGDLIERFCKKGGIKINPETRQPLKSNKKHKDIPQAVAPAPPKETPKSQPTYSAYTYKDVNTFIAIPYESKDDIFRETYSRDEYDSFVLLNKRINSLYETVRRSNRQLKFEEYVEFIEESTPTPTAGELEAAFKKLSTLGVSKDTDIYQALAECLERIRSLPPAPAAEPVQNYERDEVFEKTVLDFWGLNEVSNYKQVVLLADFCKTMAGTGQFEVFKQQFPFYMQFKTLKGAAFKHTFTNFIGKQNERFADGKWNDENWEHRLKEENKKIRKHDGTTNRKAADPEKGYGKL